ncbi:MAG: RNA methyltransferase [Arenicella sp.]
MNLQQIQFVLVEPSHPGNIGAAARAMKTMGLTRLVLVKPRQFPHADATARAAGAADILEQAIIVDELDAAIADCEWVIGTSVRDRRVSWPTMSPKKVTEALVTKFEQHPEANIAFVFGRERTGLENSELDKTQWQVRIPANPEYSSLNLAAAVQIIAYELHCHLFHSDDVPAQEGERKNTGQQQRQRLATQHELMLYYEHLQQTLEQLDFLKTKPPTKLLRKIIRLYNRADVNIEELHILRGILTATQNELNKTL